MTSINAQIDAAVVLMKKRAAKNDERTMDGITFDDLIGRAESNIVRAAEESDLCVPGGDGDAEYVRECIIDTMNLCALALSLLEAHHDH